MNLTDRMLSYILGSKEHIPYGSICTNLNRQKKEVTEKYKGHYSAWNILNLEPSGNCMDK